MTQNIFNRTIILWIGALLVAFFIVNPRAALIQRVNTFNSNRIDCIMKDDCTDTRSILEAREYYLILAKLYPHYGRGYEIAGICDLLLKEDNMATQKFQEAIKQNPDLFWISFELGKSNYRKGQYSQALKYFQDIIQQSDEDLLKKAALSDLRQYPDKTRRALMLSLIDFISEIKLSSYQMAIGAHLHLGNLTQAQNLISQGSNDPQIGQNKFFILAKASLAGEDSKNEMQKWINALAYSKPVLHPWAHVIEPLKEILYQ